MDGVSSAAIDVLLQSLINAVKEEYFLNRDLKKDAEQLQTTLEIIQAYLSDAEKKSITHDAVKVWLRKLEAVAFDADNVLDEFSYHLLHKKIKTHKSKVLSCFSSLNSITRPRNMAIRIKEINAEFECMNKRATELGLQSLVVNAPSAPLNASPETNSFTLDPIFIGRDDQVLELVEKLTHFPQEEIFSILAIGGMGGMGKTTLTRKLFSHQNIKDRFESLIWVHVSQTFDPIIIFKKILSMLSSQTTTDGVESEEGILKKLEEALKAKTYLLVLDDIWNENLPKWEHFIDSILGVTSTKGNAIIITTRSGKVASLVSPLHTHSLRGLSDEECWSIIKAKAFKNGDVPSGGLEKIGREIAKRCQGLPLAANVVGGVLRCKSEEEWRSINEKWVSDGEGGENILKILKLSYDHLPSPSLKKCFAYCSIFPKGKKIKRQHLIEQWMAEGFLEGDEMESVGNKFFNVLLHNSLLLVGGRHYITFEEIYWMHDLVHDMASSVLGYSPLRYLLLEEESSRFPEQVGIHLRTLVFKSNKVKELPSSIRKMIHLRNLDISKTSIEKLPNWIGELYHLQTLTAYSVSEVPSTLKYLINLRHLNIAYWRVELPAEIGRLIHLQALGKFRVGDKKGYKIEELGSLKNLKGGLWISNLEKVHGKEEALKANIFQKPNLFRLKFVWESERGEGETLNDESVLEGLQPHPNLEKLEIEGFKGKRFPLWVKKMAVRDGPQGSNWVPLNNLIEITFKNCGECEEIPMLEHLPNLRELLIKDCPKLRELPDALHSLNSLEKLTIENCQNLRSIGNPSGRVGQSRGILRELCIKGCGLECLPDWLFYNNQNLSELRIKDCPKLRELPDGLHTLNSMEKLTIWECQNLRSIGNPSGRVGPSQGILHTLWISGCGGLMELPRQMVESSAPSLKTLKLKELSSLENLPMLIDCLAKSTHLSILEIVGVPKLMAACSVESWDLGSLRRLEIDVSKEWSMESSVSIAETVNGILQGCCNTLDSFTLKGSENWDWLPESIQHLTSLYWLKIKNSGVEELPQWFGNLSSLCHLSLNNCKKLRCLPSGNALENLAKLRRLTIKDCPELVIDSGWRNIPHLTIKVDGDPIQS